MKNQAFRRKQRRVSLWLEGRQKFLRQVTENKNHKRETNILISLKLETPVHQKVIKKAKMQTMDLEKLFDNGLISEICKEVIQLKKLRKATNF